MSEITKLYNNAGCKKILCDCTNCKKTDCTGDIDQDTCVNLTFSPFTAEKQLKTLCFIVNNKHSVTFHDQVFGGDKLTLEKIQENLAWAINRMWEDLTPEEKQQVKGILE